MGKLYPFHAIAAVFLFQFYDKIEIYDGIRSVSDDKRSDILNSVLQIFKIRN